MSTGFAPRSPTSINALLFSLCILFSIGSHVDCKDDGGIVRVLGRRKGKGKGRKRAKSSRIKAKSVKSLKQPKQPKSADSSKPGGCAFSGSQGELQPFAFLVDIDAEGLCDDVSTQEPEKSNFERAICDYVNDSMDFEGCEEDVFTEVCTVTDYVKAATCSGRRNDRRSLLESRSRTYISGACRSPCRGTTLPGFSSINSRRGRILQAAPDLLGYIQAYFPEVTSVEVTSIEDTEVTTTTSESPSAQPSQAQSAQPSQASSLDSCALITVGNNDWVRGSQGQSCNEACVCAGYISDCDYVAQGAVASTGDMNAMLANFAQDVIDSCTSIFACGSPTLCPGQNVNAGSCFWPQPATSSCDASATNDSRFCKCIIA